MGQRTRGFTRYWLENLQTLKFERCFGVDTEFRRYLRSCQALKNFSVKGSLLQLVFPGYGAGPDPDFESTIWGQMRGLDLSGTGKYLKLIHDRVLNDHRCPVTHLFMEQCPLIPRNVHDHLKIQFLSVAGYRPCDGVEKAFDAIDAWASISTMERINASGCDLTEAERKELMKRHPNVLFNLNVQYEESPRVQF